MASRIMDDGNKRSREAGRFSERRKEKHDFAAEFDVPNSAAVSAACQAGIAGYNNGVFILMRKIWSGLACVTLVSGVAFSGGIAGQAAVVISEVMTSNDRVLADANGDYFDWLELYNSADAPVDLTGWSLTDNPGDLRKWVFPPLTLEGGGYLVVFASGTDRKEGAQLHTNFRLSASGEYLALVRPGGAVEHEYSPAMPSMEEEDRTYGLPMTAPRRLLVQAGDPALYWIPTGPEWDATWMREDFESPFEWTSTTTGVGYELWAGTKADYLGTPIPRIHTSVYVRIFFDAPDDMPVLAAVLRMRFEDGFVAYLNGTRIASENVPAALVWNARAPFDRSPSDAVRPRDYAIADAKTLIRPGRNVLAIHGMNISAGRSDLLVLPELIVTGPGSLAGLEAGVLDSPTPGGPNSDLAAVSAGEPRFSRESGLYTAPFTVELSAPEGGGTIRYTLTGLEPSGNSPEYQAPIPISRTVQVRARLFPEGGFPGPVSSRTYVQMMPDVTGFSSDLPVVVVDNYGRGTVPASGLQEAFLTIHEPQAGRTRIERTPSILTRAGIRIRGSSTLNRPKKAYAVEAWDESNEDKEISPFGMPAEADWILYAPYNFDRALMRNALVYELSNQIGRYAVRTRFVEVFVNLDRNGLAYSDYQGVYVFMEKIKRDKDRVDVERLLPEDSSEPRISGGYMLKIDRLDPGDSGFSAGGQALNYHYPKEQQITGVQAGWLQNYINGFGSVLNSPQFSHPASGYAAFIDVDSWIDHHLINEFTKNPDGLRLSTYLHKKRGGKIEMGPVWDFDRTMGCDDDDRALNPAGWSNSFSYGWWGRLFQDPNFYQKYIDRWHQLRQGPMHVENIHAIIDRMADEVREAQARNFQKWALVGRDGWTGEVQQLKTWAAARLVWFDSQFPRPPLFSREPGIITSPAELAISLNNPQGRIFYTLDGRDPRASGGGVAAGGREYLAGSPIMLEGTAEVWARVQGTGFNPRWSPITKAFFVDALLPELVLTELMYHPAPSPGGFDKDDYEFIEIQNAGDATVNLAGLRFREGIQFNFPNVSLGSKAIVVIAKNPEAFRERHGPGNYLLLGGYDGNLSNSGEWLMLEDAAGRTLFEVAYRDSGAWPSQADGNGSSLEVIDAHGNYFDPANWRASAGWGGSPGQIWTEPLRINSFSWDGSVVTLRFVVPPDGRYTVMRSFGLDGPWEAFTPGSTRRVGGEEEITDTRRGGNARFYQIRWP